MKAFALDMDGTIYMGGKSIPGAPEFISELRERGIPFVFLTNNSSHTREFYRKRLCDMGIPAEEQDIQTSAVVTAGFITRERPGKTVYPIATPEIVREMESLGVTMTDKDPDIVLLSFDTSITYEKINSGFHYILAGAELIATHPDDVCPTEDSYDVDIGPFIRLFESLAHCTATVIGKPNALMLETAASIMGVEPKDVVMVGDRLYTDMRMAADAGTESILVLSGETSLKDLRGSDIRPTHVFNSVADIISSLRF